MCCTSLETIASTLTPIFMSFDISRSAAVASRSLLTGTELGSGKSVRECFAFSLLLHSSLLRSLSRELTWIYLPSEENIFHKENLNNELQKHKTIFWIIFRRAVTVFCVTYFISLRAILMTWIYCRSVSCRSLIINFPRLIFCYDDGKMSTTSIHALKSFAF